MDTKTQIDRYTDTERQIDGYTGKRKDLQTDIEGDRQMDRWTNIHRKTSSQTQTHNIRHGRKHVHT